VIGNIVIPSAKLIYSDLWYIMVIARILDVIKRVFSPTNRN